MYAAELSVANCKLDFVWRIYDSQRVLNAHFDYGNIDGSDLLFRLRSEGSKLKRGLRISFEMGRFVNWVSDTQIHRFLLA